MHHSNPNHLIKSPSTQHRSILPTLHGFKFMAMVQNPVPPVNIPIPTKIGSKMGGEFTYQPIWHPKTVLTTTATLAFVTLTPVVSFHQGAAACRISAASASSGLEKKRSLEFDSSETRLPLLGPPVDYFGRGNLVRISWYQLCSVDYFGRGTLPKKRVKWHCWGT